MNAALRRPKCHFRRKEERKVSNYDWLVTDRKRIKQSQLSVSPAEMEVVEDLIWRFIFEKKKNQL